MALLRLFLFSRFLAASCLSGGSAAAQTFAVEKIDNPAADFGRIISGASGDTVFRIDAATGDVTKVRGAGSRMSASSARTQITVKCSKGGKKRLCDSEMARVQIGAVGATTGRALSLKRLKVAANTGKISAPSNGGDTLSFAVGPLGEKGTATFYLGADFGVAGDTSGLATGPASAQFYVTVSKEDGSGSSTRSGIIEANVLRQLSLVTGSDLNFGTVTRPTAGSGRIVIDPDKGTRTLEGEGVQGLSSFAVGPASFTVNGEGGQVFSVSVPTSFQMKAKGESVTVTISHNAQGQQTLKGKAGTEGTSSFNVGGTFPLTSTMRSGTYTGTFLVSVQYN